MNYPEPGLYFIIVLSVVSDREGHFNIVFVPAEHSSIKYSTENTRENENKTENLIQFHLTIWPMSKELLQLAIKGDLILICSTRVKI